MERIKLKSHNYEIIKLNRKTKAAGFCNLKVGDIIYFETEIKPIGRNKNCNSLYASGFSCINAKTKEHVGGFTHNTSPHYLDIFELKDLEVD